MFVVGLCRQLLQQCVQLSAERGSSAEMQQETTVFGDVPEKSWCTLPVLILGAVSYSTLEYGIAGGPDKNSTECKLP